MKEVVKFQGIKFYRRKGRPYFTPGIQDAQRGIDALHRELWKAKRGPIPKGWHVHHVDGDTLNNRIGNLDCVSPKEHRRIHGPSVPSPIQRIHLRRIRPLAAAWHSSKEGVAWHREHGRKTTAARQLKDVVCRHCGLIFQSKVPWCAVFCTPSCRNDHDPRRKKYRAWQLRCPHCGREFEATRGTQKHCSRTCANLHRWKRHRESANP